MRPNTTHKESIDSSNNRMLVRHRHGQDSN